MKMPTWTARMRAGVAVAAAGGALALAVAMAAGAGASHAVRPAATGGAILAVAGENEYQSVIAQIGGPYVRAIGIMNNPSIDPHAYEASTATAAAVATARLIVQNGLGYDTFMNKLEAASPRQGRIVLTVASIVGAAPGTPNPHLWYKPTTMPRVATAIATALGRLEPAHAAYFRAHARTFVASLGAWTRALARLRTAYHGAPVAVTEPVADYLLQASGLTIRTPWAFQASVMNGTDPSPQAVAAEDALLTDARVRVLVYNQQTVTATTTPLIALARAHRVPIVGVYETMPPRMTYQTWMVAETDAVYRALKDRTSTVTQ